MTQIRLTKLLHGRTQTEFGDSLGLNRGTTSRIFSGKPINNDILTRLMQKENVSLSWLHGGYGAPYNVVRTNNPKETFDQLAKHIETGEYELFLITGYEVITFVFAKDSFKLDNKGVSFKYIASEIFSGPVNQSSLKLLKTQTKLLTCLLDYDDAERLSIGNMGTHELFGWTERLDIENTGFSGKLKDTELITDESLNYIFEQYSESRNEMMVNEAIMMVDDSLAELGIYDIAPEKRRKITVELYKSIVSEGYTITPRVHDLARKILRVVS